MRKVSFLTSLVILLFFMVSCIKDTLMRNNVSVRLLCEGAGISDKSFNESIWNGILSFYNGKNAERGVEYESINSQTVSDRESIVRATSETGNIDLVILAGDTWEDIIERLIDQYPNQKYFAVDMDMKVRKNLKEVQFRTEEAAYLTGQVAALKAIEEKKEDSTFGYIGGMQTPVVTSFEMGFLQGLRSILPNAKFIDFYLNNWSAPELAKAQAKNWFDNGVFCVFCVAGSSGNGVISYGKECRNRGQDAWVIGVDMDQYEDGIYKDDKSVVLTSALKLLSKTVKDTLEEIEKGEFKSGDLLYGLEEGAVGFSTRNPELSQEIIKRVEKTKQDIIDGKIEIEIDYEKAVEKGLAPAGLDAW